MASIVLKRTGQKVWDTSTVTSSLVTALALNTVHADASRRVRNRLGYGYVYELIQALHWHPLR